MDSYDLEALVIQHTHRIPAPEGPAGSGDVAARQLDAVLMSAGFKLSRDALAHLSSLGEGTVIDAAVRVLPTVRAMVGDHVRHNVYFRDFPRNVPDTLDFWVQCLSEALLDSVAAPRVAAGAQMGVLNLLDMPSYGRYLHTYEEMLAAHDDLIAAAGDRVTVLQLGGTFAEEAQRLYLALAGSVTPLNEADLQALRVLAEHCAAGPQPERIPVRENRALINQVRLDHGADLLLDTVTDVLRLACALSGGDVTLTTSTRFTSMPRPIRRALLAGLDGIVQAASAKLADVGVHQEEWKRLGERLHPHEHPQYPHASQVFAVARGEQAAPSLASRVDRLLAAGDVACATSALRTAPGMLFRSLDRLLRSATTPAEPAIVLEAAEEVAGKVSGRVLLSVREHLQNRTGKPGQARIFANQLGRGMSLPDTRPPLDPEVVEQLTVLLDREVQRRLPPAGHLVVDPDVLDVALPLSGKATADGLGVLPRGSVSRVDGELLRFFIYWHQRTERTDFDLSALMLDGDYRNARWLSYTSLSQFEGEHSGDITSAPDGASEFINLRLRETGARFIIPEVLVYSGEGFDEVRESFFGFMLRDSEQQGRPFEARTVRMKSELRGPGRIALPLVFMRGDDGRWRAMWLHLFLKGRPSFNQVEGNRVSASMLIRSVVERRYLNVRYLVDLMAAQADSVTVWDGKEVPAGPVTFIGLGAPEGLHEESEVFTPTRFRELIPA